MEIDERYRHKYMPNLTCIIIAPTIRGAKVKQTLTQGRRSKSTTQYYDSADFSGDRQLWIIQTPSLGLETTAPNAPMPAHKTPDIVFNQIVINF